MKPSLNIIDGQTKLDKLLRKGCLVYYPEYCHHFPIVFGKLLPTRFVGIFYKAETLEDYITFTFDHIFETKNGIFFSENWKFKSYCVLLNEFMVGSEKTETHQHIKDNRKHYDIKKLRDEIFSKYS